jgi:nucleotide-binding universal stress UspA family protein
MFQRILVPLDGSTLAERALPVAARLARACGGTIILFRSLSFLPELVSYMAFQQIAIAPTVSIELGKYKVYLDKTASKKVLVGIAVETEAVLDEPVPGILSAVERHHSDLVVMSSHGYTGIMHWVLGSVAEKVARLSTVPVLLRPESSNLGNTTAHEDLLQVLIPLDGSERAETAIVPAGQMVSALSVPGRGGLHLLQVLILPGTDASSSSHRDDIVRTAESYIQKTVERVRSGQLASPLAGLGLSITGSVTIDVDIAAALGRVAEPGKHDSTGKVVGPARPSQMIAIAIHGYRGLHLLTMGSITGRTLLATRLPILVVQSPAMKSKTAPAQRTVEVLK